MPRIKKRLTVKETTFVKVMSSPPDPDVAALAAGYAQPRTSAWKLMQNPLIVEATREEARRFLLEKAGSLSVYGLATIGLDEKQPAGARVSAFKELGKMSGIAINDGETGKEPHEMDASELHSHRARLEQQRQAIDKALADRARPIVDADPIVEIVDDEPEKGAFG